MTVLQVFHLHLWVYSRNLEPPKIDQLGRIILVEGAGAETEPDQLGIGGVPSTLKVLIDEDGEVSMLTQGDVEALLSGRQ